MSFTRRLITQHTHESPLNWLINHSRTIRQPSHQRDLIETFSPLITLWIFHFASFSAVMSCHETFFSVKWNRTTTGTATVNKRQRNELWIHNAKFMYFSWSSSCPPSVRRELTRLLILTMINNSMENWKFSCSFQTSAFLFPCWCLHNLNNVETRWILHSSPPCMVRSAVNANERKN